MNRLSKLSVALIAASIAVSGCCKPAPELPPPPQTFTLTVKVTERDGKLQIEKSHTEELVELYDGDRLAWKCEWTADDLGQPCPEEVAFTVRNIQPVANLSWEGSEEEVEERVKNFVERFESVLEGEPVKGRMAEEALFAELPPEALEMLEEDRGPFEAMLTDLTTYGAGSIISPPYAKFDRELLWKFEWAVARGDDSDSWDPHFRGHRKR